MEVYQHQPVRKRQKKRVLKSNKPIQKRLDFAANKFSKELVLKVFSYLSSKDLIQCAVVSLEWSRMANDEMLWKPLFLRQFRDPPLSRQQEANRIHYQNSSKRRASVTRYGGSWKTKYRIHHNWVLGNCYINDVVNPFNSSYNPHYRHQLQFLHDYIFIVQHDSACIDIWKYVEKGSEYLSQFRSSVIDSDDVHITFLKLFEREDTNYLIAGYSNGGFTLWEASSSSHCLVGEIKELTNYMPRSACIDKVTSIGMEYPMILVCTESMKLSVFHVNPKTFSLKLVHCLQSPIDWAPVVIDVQKYYPSFDSCNSNSNSNRRNCKSADSLFKVVVCFGLSGGNYTTSIGIQELVLSTSSVISSSHGFALNYEPIYPSSPLTSSSSIQRSPEQITSMVYTPPHLITAHPNNTLKQYTVALSDNHSCSLDIKFEQTLYGHTYQVDTLAIDTARQKLLSGDRSGIKVWDLASGECQVTLNIHKNQSQMNELPLFHIETLGSDEEKIVAVVNSVLEKKSFIRLWSFSSMLK